jgi:chaperone BCS1
MTSNLPEQLDEALVRPGRIDVKIYMGHITPSSAEQIFLRMMKMGMLDKVALSGALSFHADDDDKNNTKTGNAKPQDDAKREKRSQTEIEEELKLLAKQFSEHIPEATFTPAQLQGYLLRHLHSATTAVDKIGAWVAEEKRKMDEEAAEKEKKRKTREKMKKEGPTNIYVAAAGDGERFLGDQYQDWNNCAFHPPRGVVQGFIQDCHG